MSSVQFRVRPDGAAASLRRMLARTFVVLAIGALTLIGGCARLPQTGVTALKPESLDGLQRHLLSHKADFAQFRLRGPFEVTTREDLELRISPGEHYEADAYLSASPEKAPLVIVLHGHENSKEDHAYQCMHLASWGMHSIAVQLPNTGPWIKNGEILAQIVRFIQRRPDSIDARIDPRRIIVVGHSFGAYSAAIALGNGAPALGAVLLDPAGMGRAMPAHLRKIRSPVMVLGSDGNIGLTRNRGYFYEYIRSNVAEVSIAGAGHDDATFPLESGWWGSDASTTEEKQITFVAALTATAFSLGFTGKLDYAWASFAEALRSGEMFDGLRK
jgi:pimeloyl-ACP methyl ester carboxylesterase